MGTLTLEPPDDVHLSITVPGGRTYGCDAGTTITVPDFDGYVMQSNGWIIVGNTAVFGLQSTLQPSGTLMLDPETGDVYQTTPTTGTADGQ